jgi:hypothetical protein
MPRVLWELTFSLEFSDRLRIGGQFSVVMEDGGQFRIE